MLKQLTVGLTVLFVIGVSLSCVAINQEPSIAYRDYDAKGGYISNDGTKVDWRERFSLFDTHGHPVLDSSLRFYVTNYEDRLGKFTVRVNFWDDNDLVESFDYRTISVGPHETEYGYISFEALWRHKPGRADSFNVALDVPQIKE